MPKKKSTVVNKPPVVTIMGHVDHGKTTLLDHIRKTRVAAREAGGITQQIGAYQIEHQGKPITFIDTPGHAAFTKMRAQGASVTDLVVLVVAADDGVMPQTKESIRLIKENSLPVVVAINKMDLPGASPDMVKAQLVENNIMVEGYGGDVPVVNISARNGENIDVLMETITVLAEVEELTADPNGPLEAVVLEAALEQNQGPTATVLVNNGTLEHNDELITLANADDVVGKVKRLRTDMGKIVKKAGPSVPVELLGLKRVPQAGTILTRQVDVEAVREHLKERLEFQALLEEEARQQEASFAQAAEARADEDDDEDKKTVKVVLVADTQGSLQAITQNLRDEVDVIKAGTGEISESDVLMAMSTKSKIVGFNVKVNNSAKRLAEIEKVTIKTYNIIYKLLEDFEKQVMKMLEPTIDEEELGVAKIKAIFNMRGDVILGCVVTSGAVSVQDQVHLKRNDKIIATGLITSLKQGQVDVKKIEKDTECGLITKPAFDAKEGDYLQTFKKVDD